MYSIYKYKLCGTEPISADVLDWLSIGRDPAGEPCVWACVKVDSENKKFYRFNQISTGWSFDDNENVGIYLGTMNEGPYVWHYFAQEVIPQKKSAKPPVDELDDFYAHILNRFAKEHCFA